MRHNPSSFSSLQYLMKKKNVIWPQETKTMKETAYGFERYVLSYFGLPSIL